MVKQLLILVILVCALSLTALVGQQGRVEHAAGSNDTSIEQTYSSINAVPIAVTPFWQSSEPGVYSTGLAWDDIDHDGYLDAFLGNGNDMALAQNMMYKNKRGVVSSIANWRSTNAEYTGHGAVGDINDDGYPDFVVSNYLGAGRFGTLNRSNLYLNNNGSLSSSPDWVSVDSTNSFSCALGDIDNDGDLDLAVATGDAYYSVFTPEKIYYNNNGMFETSASWESALNTAAMDVTLGDIDKDGDLDMAVATDVEGALVFYNNTGIMETTPSWACANTEPANTLILSDVNNDSWLDLVVAFNNQLGPGGNFRLYLNDGTGTLHTSPDWESASGGYGSGVATYDYDLDGDLDLAAGRWFDQPRLYENLGDTFSSLPVWRADWATVVEELVWVDIDADGVELFADTIAASGLQKLFYLSRNSLYSIDSVIVDGSKLSEAAFCFDLIAGWVSLASPPMSSMICYYRFSHTCDLTMSNWDTCNLAYANSTQPYVLISADTGFGFAPLPIQFNDNSIGGSNWYWDFDDGNFSTEQNPNHTYTQPGIFDVSLSVDLSDGPHTREQPQMVIVLADTIIGAHDSINGISQLTYSIQMTNSMPLTQIDIPVDVNGTLPLTFVDFSVEGCRTDYFNEAKLDHYDGFNKRYTFQLRCGDQPELQPGSGAVIKLIFDVGSSAQTGQSSTLSFDGYTTHQPRCLSSVWDYVPILETGSIGWYGCCLGQRGNINNDSEDLLDITDLLYFVDYFFAVPIGPAPECPEEADVNASGVIDISDLLYLVDYFFDQPPGPPPIQCQ